MQERKLTRKMKLLLKKRGLNPSNWRYIRHTPTELTIVHKHTATKMTIELKGAGEREKANADAGQSEGLSALMADGISHGGKGRANRHGSKRAKKKKNGLKAAQ